MTCNFFMYWVNTYFVQWNYWYCFSSAGVSECCVALHNPRLANIWGDLFCFSDTRRLLFNKNNAQRNTQRKQTTDFNLAQENTNTQWLKQTHMMTHITIYELSSKKNSCHRICNTWKKPKRVVWSVPEGIVDIAVKKNQKIRMTKGHKLLNLPQMLPPIFM